MADAKAFKEAFKTLNEFGAEKPGKYNVYELTVTRTNNKTVTKFFTPRQKDTIEEAKMWIDGIDLRKYVAVPPGAAAPPAGAAAPPAAGAPVVVRPLPPHPAPYKPYHALQESEQLKSMTKTAGPQGPGFSIGSGRRYRGKGLGWSSSDAEKWRGILTGPISNTYQYDPAEVNAWRNRLGFNGMRQGGTGHTHINRARPFFMKGRGKIKC